MTLTRHLDRQTERVSALALHVAVDRVDGFPLPSPKADASKRTLPITGQSYTYSRAAAGASVTGSDGSSVPAVTRDLPVFVAYDLDSDGDYERLALQLTSAEVLDIDIAFPPMALGIYFDFIAGADAPSFSLGDSVAPHLTLSTPSTRTYRIEHDNNVDAAVNVTTALAASSGVRVQLWAILYANGSVALWSRYDEGSWVSEGASSAPASGLASAWSSAVAALVTDGTDDILAAKVDAGPVYDHTTIEQVF